MMVLPAATPSTKPFCVKPPFVRGTDPLYSQLAALLRQRLSRGIWAVGEMLPSIEELILEFGVARATVRHAIELLTREGLISPQPGRGTVVISPAGKERLLRLETSLHALADVYRNDKPKLTLLEESSARPPLRPGDGEPATGYHFMRRVHSRDGEAFCVISLYLDERVFRMAPSKFRRETVIPVLLALPKVKIARARQTLTVTTADVEIAEHLAIPLNAPVANVRRVFVSADGTVLYLGEVTYRGDYIHFEMDLRT
jgi:GntR family transcriptional regulator